MGTDFEVKLAARDELIQHLEKENELQAKLIEAQKEMITHLESYSADLQAQIYEYLHIVQEG